LDLSDEVVPVCPEEQSRDLVEVSSGDSIRLHVSEWVKFQRNLDNPLVRRNRDRPPKAADGGGIRDPKALGIHRVENWINSVFRSVNRRKLVNWTGR